MSEAEKLKRLAYKKNRKKRIIWQLAVISVLLLAILVSVFMYYKLNQTYYIEYTEDADVNYRVYLKENNFYQEEYLDGGQEYVASLIDSVNANLRYELNTDVDGVEYEYSYGINAHLVIVGKNNGVTVLNRAYPIKEAVTVNDAHGAVEIKETVNIDYAEYNSFAKRFFTDLELNSNNFESSLIVTMTVNVSGAFEELASDAKNKYEVSLNIPLTLDTVEIDIGTTVPTAEKKVLVCKNAIDTTVFKRLAIGGAVLEVVLIVILIAFIGTTRNEDINYNIRVKRIVGAYKSFIQKINNEFDTAGYQLLFVDTFNEMLSIRDTLQSPVLMNENEDQTMTRFLVPTNTNILYVFDIKVDNYDEIYGVRDAAAADDEILSAHEEELEREVLADTVSESTEEAENINDAEICGGIEEN